MVGIVVVAVVVGGLLWSAVSSRPAAAQHPNLFGGSLVLEDSRPLTVIDVATAQITVRLEGVESQVGASNYGDVQPVPVTGGTMLVNRVTGNFNFLGADNYVSDPSGPGVGLGPLPGSTAARGYGAGDDAYILRSGPDSTVSLVGRQTVAQAAKAAAGSGSQAASKSKAGTAAVVPPLGYSTLGGPASAQPGSATVLGSDLWVLVGQSSCQVLQLHPDVTKRQGLITTRRGAVPVGCSRVAAESGTHLVGVASPGQVRLYPTGRPAVTVATPATATATRIVAVRGAASTLWFLANDRSGWQLVGVGAGGEVTGPFPLKQLGAGANPVDPVLAGGFLYTLDQNQTPQPTLWTVDVSNGHMSPLGGVARYPVVSKTEKEEFRGAQVLVDGPRVVYNNPQSVAAVVVFTDGSHAPVVVDKSLAVSVSTTGPAELNPTSSPGGKKRQGSGSNATKTPLPVVQPVSQQVTCATTTQKPYAPQISGLTPSSGTVLVQWSYQLLDQTDCEPDSWSVHVTALTGSHQPSQPVQTVTGQQQYMFTGLRPSTTYQAVVTAYINKQSTPSTAATFTTSARGPDAPLSVTTQADGAGHWIVSWTPCTESANANCVVPADLWTVTGAACGGGFVGTPPSIQVAGDQDTATIDAAGSGLLGDSLSFSVQGSLASGLTGNPTDDHSCTEAYAKPNPADVSVVGSGKPVGNTITATLQVLVSGGNPAAALGAPQSETEFVYQVDGRTVGGPTSQSSVTVPGLAAGMQHTPSVTIYPAGTRTPQ